MLSAREVGIVAQREVLRNLRSTKGIAMFSLFLLGGVVFSVLVSLIVSALVASFAKQTGTTTIPDDFQRSAWEAFLAWWYKDEAIAKNLSAMPAALWALSWGTLKVLPILVLVVGFDQLAGEIQHRAIRYTVGRAHRASIVVGKALGTWAVVAIMILVLHLTVWVILLARGQYPLGEILSWGGRFWLFSSICAGAYVGYVAAVSSLFSTPIVALFAGAGGGALLWLAFQACNWLSLPAVWAFPNAYEKLLLLPGAGTVAGGCGLFVLWGAACVLLATFVMAKRDV
jgi:ABC-type transport system involved in multi-copper enzyme maturation permease subunit